MNLLQLAVAHGLLIGWGCRIGVELDLDIKDGLIVAFRGAKGGQEKRGLEGLGRGQELDGELGLFLFVG